MSELNQLGKVITTDVLVIGAGNSGVIAAQTIKSLNSSVDVLCIDRNYFGYNGKSIFAGHGIIHMSPEDDVDHFVQEQVEKNTYGLYLNDQEYLYESTRRAQTYISELEDLGAVFAHNPDGSLHYHREFPTKPSSACNLDIDWIVPVSRRALAKGVRIMERTYFTDLLTKDGRVVGAVGFSMDNPEEFIIFRAKAVVMAVCEFNACVRLMFFSPATGLNAAYEAGCQLRNAEQSTQFDLCRRNTGNFLYGAHWVIYNQKGENLYQKYNSNNFEEIDYALLLGMQKEVREGNGPLYVDFSKLPKHSETEGEGFNMGMLMPNRLALDALIFKDEPDHLDNPEVSLATYVFNRGLRVDIDAKTTVPGLWATGGGTLSGCAYGGWVHGDGVGFCARSGLSAGKSIAREIDDLELGEVDLEQVKFFKDRLYEVYDYTGEDLPYKLIHYLDRVLCLPENCLNRTEETIQEFIDLMHTERANLSTSIHVPRGSGHHLAKAVEARAMIDQLAVLFTAHGARKETRGIQFRSDYPERDDKNWLKWVILTRGEDGEPKVTFERIPFERYKFKPEGWTPEQAAQ